MKFPFSFSSHHEKTQNLYIHICISIYIYKYIESINATSKNIQERQVNVFSPHVFWQMWASTVDADNLTSIGRKEEHIMERVVFNCTPMKTSEQFRQWIGKMSSFSSNRKKDEKRKQ